MYLRGDSVVHVLDTMYMYIDRTLLAYSAPYPPPADAHPCNIMEMHWC